MMTYNGLESCIINNQSYENDGGTSRGDGDGCLTDSVDEDYSSCSSSNNASGSFSSHWTSTKSKKDEKLHDEWQLSDSPEKIYVKEKQAYKVENLDVGTMKQKFAKLLLGDDITGGRKGVSSALALSNAITNLAALVFGELWKLEPLSEERKKKWQKEMDWLLSPTNYMIELVPAKQHSIDGQTLELDSYSHNKHIISGEMLVGPSNILFMDEISTGLDNSTTYQIVNSLRHAVHILQKTALISLLQPAPETYDLFDDIIAL